MSQDTLSDILRGVRLRGAVFFFVSGHGEWAAEAPPGKELAPLLMRGVDHVIEYHAQWRMQAAARLLLDTRASVAAIALDVGYESEAAFARAFKRLVGKPPATWRREREKGLA